MTPTIGRVVRYFLGYMLTETKPRQVDPERPVYRTAEIVDVHTDGSVALHVKLRGEHDFRNVVPTPGGSVVTSDESRSNLKLVENAKEGTTPGTFHWPSVPARTSTLQLDLTSDPKFEAMLKGVFQPVADKLAELEQRIEPGRLFDAMEAEARARYHAGKLFDEAQPTQEQQRPDDLRTGPDGDVTRTVETNGSIANPNEPPAAPGSGPKPGDVLPDGRVVRLDGSIGPAPITEPVHMDGGTVTPETVAAPRIVEEQPVTSPEDKAVFSPDAVVAPPAPPVETVPVDPEVSPS